MSLNDVVTSAEKNDKKEEKEIELHYLCKIFSWYSNVEYLWIPNKNSSKRFIRKIEKTNLKNKNLIVSFVEKLFKFLVFDAWNTFFEIKWFFFNFL